MPPGGGREQEGLDKEIAEFYRKEDEGRFKERDEKARLADEARVALLKAVNAGAIGITPHITEILTILREKGRVFGGRKEKNTSEEE